MLTATLPVLESSVEDDVEDLLRLAAELTEELTDERAVRFVLAVMLGGRVAEA